MSRNFLFAGLAALVFVGFFYAFSWLTMSIASRGILYPAVGQGAS